MFQRINNFLTFTYDELDFNHTIFTSIFYLDDLLLQYYGMSITIPKS